MPNSNLPRRRVVGWTALLVALAAWLLWPAPNPATPAPPETTTRIAPQAPPDRAPPRRAPRDAVESAVDAANAQPPTTAPPTPTPPAEPGVRIRIRVLRADGTPAANVQIAVLLHDRFPYGLGADTPPTRAERARGVTASDGTVDLTTPSGALWGGRIVAWDGDDAASTEKTLYAKSGQDAGVELKLGRRFRVRGTVVDSAGRRLEDAVVKMIVSDTMATMTSSSCSYGYAVEPLSFVHGRFEFAPVAQDEFAKGFVLDVRAEGFLVQAFRIDDDVAQRGDVAVRLQRPRTVRGRVLTASGAPFAGAQVTARAGLSDAWNQKPALSVTDVDGRFALAGLAEDAVDLHVEAARWTPRTVRADASSSTEFAVADIVLDGGDTIRGDVVDADGRAVAAAHVYWHAADVSVHGQTVADADGRFVLEHVASGPLRLYVSDGGSTDNWYESATSVDGVACGGPPLHVVLTGARLLRIDIDYERGSELPDDPPYHRVIATSAVDGTKVFDASPRKRTSMRYKFDAVGAYDLVVELAGYDSVRQRIEISDARETRVAVRMRRASK